MSKRHRSRAHNPNYHIRPISAERVEKILYGQSLPDMHTQERLEKARKEHQMPDIKTALTNALSTTIKEWAKDDQPKEKTMTQPRPSFNPVKQPNGAVRFTETVGVARAVFNKVFDNPAIPRQQAVDALVAAGYKKSSVGSLITQNIRAGVFRLDGHGRLHCEAKTYKPLPSSKKRTKLPTPKPTPKPVKTIKPKADAGIAALKPDTVKFFDPMEFIEQLSVLQAKNVYDRLKQIFGA